MHQLDNGNCIEQSRQSDKHHKKGNVAATPFSDELKGLPLGHRRRVSVIHKSGQPTHLSTAREVNNTAR
jgi:hypothetical protein